MASSATGGTIISPVIFFRCSSIHGYQTSLPNFVLQCLLIISFDTCFLSPRFSQRVPNQQTIRGQHRISCTYPHCFSYFLLGELISFLYGMLFIPLLQTREERLCEVFGVYGNIIDCRVAGRIHVANNIDSHPRLPYRSYLFVHTRSTGIT